MKEAEKYLRKRGGRVIVVSFTSDPYQWEEERIQLTRRVLEVLSKARQHRVLILTKNPKLALRDLDLMLRHGDMWLGATVVSLERNEYEPLAPPPEDRLEALKQAKQRGVKTWLSIEPIIPSITYPEDIVEVTLGYVDWYVLGSLNYCRQLKLHSLTEGTLKLWYAAHVKSAVELLKKHGKQFHIKRELLKLIPFITGKCSECLHNYMDFCLEHREKVSCLLYTSPSPRD